MTRLLVAQILWACLIVGPALTSGRPGALLYSGGAAVMCLCGVGLAGSAPEPGLLASWFAVITFVVQAVGAGVLFDLRGDDPRRQAIVNSLGTWTWYMAGLTGMVALAAVLGAP